ncbi:hypothetical protein BZG36_01821 [Bifiguratus adelaidae]|uniref:NADH dehydrogenase [ubiquinone] 1 beta subcomplex subunit 9 n=1 Tax=Bifiguratus adelaidae TaxID=1938954 RepID=A0A261Y2B5_9FUNG|nr:hypothetical protein BZG36_01821 [Bifiguratus adelaidae]
MQLTFLAAAALAVASVSAQSASSTVTSVSNNYCYVTSPIQGTVWTAGTNVTIVWLIDTADNNVFPTVNLLHGNPAYYTFAATLATNVKTTLGQVTVTVPANSVPGNDYGLQIGQAPNYCYAGPFTIKAAGAASAPTTPSIPTASGPSMVTAASTTAMTSGALAVSSGASASGSAKSASAPASGSTSASASASASTSAASLVRSTAVLAATKRRYGLVNRLCIRGVFGSCDEIPIKVQLTFEFSESGRIRGLGRGAAELSLYKRSLKTSLDWYIRRDLWRQKALDIRAQFEANKHITSPKELEQIFAQTEKELDKWAHPDPYKFPLQPEGSKWERNIPPRMNWDHIGHH